MTNNTTITRAAIQTDNAFRNAFAAICRRALPYMAADAYHMDLLYDAESAARMNPGDRIYLLVRTLGTFVYMYGDDAVAQIPKTDGQAVLRVVRGSFDSFTVTIVYDLAAGYR